MSLPLSPSSGGLLAQLRVQLNADLEAAKAEIQSKLGTVVTEVHAKVSQVDQGLLQLTDAGKRVMEELDRQKGETVTRIQAVIGEATAEFDKQRTAIGQVAAEVTENKQAIGAMTSRLRDELDQLKGQMASLHSSVASRGLASSGDDGVRQELDAIKADILLLKSVDASRGLAPPGEAGGGKLGGFIPWKSMTPKPFGNKEEHWREWVDEVRDYLDMVRPGMKQLLVDSETEQLVVVDAAWASG